MLTFGTQVDARTVRTGWRTGDPQGALAPDQVAGYLAKYSTKDSSGLHGHGQQRPHILALRRECPEMASRVATVHPTGHDYQRMSKWVHCLGFRGHFGTKSRRYSITLGALRRARTRWQALAEQSRRTGEPIDTRDLEARLLAEDEDETTQVIGTWTYIGTAGATTQKKPSPWPSPPAPASMTCGKPNAARTGWARHEGTMMEQPMQDEPTPALERLLTTAEVPFSPRYQREDVAAWVKRSAA